MHPDWWLPDLTSRRSRNVEWIYRNRRGISEIGLSPTIDRSLFLRLVEYMPEMIERVDILLRGGAVAALAICALIFLGYRGPWFRSLSVSALCAGLCAYLLVSSPSLGLAGTWTQNMLVWVAGVVPALAVWAGAEIFLDRPVYRPRHFGVAIAVAAGAWLAPLSDLAASARGILVVGLYGALLFLTFSTAAGDLVESRRRFRRWFVTLMAVAGLAVSVVELLRLDDSLPAWIYPLHGATFLFMTTAFLFWATRIAPDVLPVRKEPDQPANAPLPPAEAAVLQRIEAAMSQGLWRQEGLTIAQLAARVDAPEHRVRRAINRGLGHRNFAQYINGQRISAAQEVLSDPARADTPVLSIAYDVGFASVGPFNRAFRDVTGQSPTEYRKSRADGAST